MLNIHSTNLGQQGPGRIFITGSEFGFDLSPDWVRADFQREEETEKVSFSCRDYIMPIRRTWKLNLEFGMDSMTMYKPNLAHWSTLLFLDKDIPSLPERPIWLPPGSWECAYCTTTQSSHHLQCRSCGAPRVGDDARRIWGER